jgi:hypothetical protein
VRVSLRQVAFIVSEVQIPLYLLESAIEKKNDEKLGKNTSTVKNDEKLGTDLLRDMYWAKCPLGTQPDRDFLQ